MADDEVINEPDDKFPLDWKSVEPAAVLGFDIWTGHPELAWAKTAFGYLPGHGLSPDNAPFNDHIAIFRFLVLIGIYHDFCEAAWDQTSWISYSEWCEPFHGIDRFVIGQLFSQLPGWDADEDVDFSDAMDRLVEAERDTVVKALCKGFGGVSGLYASLWRSVPPSGDDGESDDYECFDPNDVGKLKAYEWVSQGCPRLGERD
jgi:hypothetical protein